jgi:hypothetical protein
VPVQEVDSKAKSGSAAKGDKKVSEPSSGAK